MSASEAKGRFGDLLRRVGKGETISTCSEAFVLPTWRRQILARSGPSRRSWRNSPASTRGIRLRNITVRELIHEARTATEECCVQAKVNEAVARWPFAILPLAQEEVPT